MGGDVGDASIRFFVCLLGKRKVPLCLGRQFVHDRKDGFSRIALNPLASNDTPALDIDQLAVAELTGEIVADSVVADSVEGDGELEFADFSSDEALEPANEAPRVPVEVASALPTPATTTAVYEEPLEIQGLDSFERPSFGEPTSDVSLYEAQEVELDTPAPPSSSATPPGFGVQTIDAESQFVGEPISMSLKDADITEVLRSIARISNLNIVIQPGVSGTERKRPSCAHDARPDPTL